MSLSQRKVNTAAFTSALKQVFYIHKNVVSELCAKLDILTDECKLLKTNSHNPGSSGRCESCVSLKKMNRSQQEHFNSLLHEKNMDIKVLEEKLQSLTGETDTENVKRKKDKTLPKKISHLLIREESQSVKGHEFVLQDLDIMQHPQNNYKDNVDMPLETCNPRETGNLKAIDLCKGHTRLSLTRQSKRNCNNIEEQREAKRMKMSPSTSERDKNSSVHKLNATGHNDAFFVPDTDFSTQQRKLRKSQLRYDFSESKKSGEADSDNNQIQQILVVPETLAIDNSSFSDNENDNKLNNLNGRNNYNEKKPLSIDENFDHTNDEHFLEDFNDKIYENNMDSVKSSSTADCCILTSKESLHDVSNNCYENGSLSFSRRQSESERNCKSKPTRLLFQEEGSFRQFSGDKKNDLTDVIQRKGIFQNSIGIEESRKINKVEFVVEQFPHKNKIKNASTHGIDSQNCFGDQRAKQESQDPRKTSIASVINKVDQGKQENTNSNTKNYPIGQDHNGEKNDDKMPSVKSVQQTTLNQTMSVPMGKIEIKNNKTLKSDLEEKEKLQMAKAIQRSLKCIENKSPRKSESIKVDVEFQVIHCSPDLDFAKSKHKLMSNTRKEIVSNRLTDSLVASYLSPVPSCAPSELKNTCHEGTSRIQNESLSNNKSQILDTTDLKLKGVQISSLAPPELNGSLNPAIHLSEYLHSEMVTEKQTVCNFDETIAPNLISQYVLSEENENPSLLARLNAVTNMTDQTITAVISTENSKPLQMMETLKRENSWNNLSQSPVIMVGTPRKIFQKSCRQSLNESKPEVKDDWCDYDDDDDNIFTGVEDDPETIEPSPQQKIQNGSQLHGNIPSISCSFRFIHKQPQLASKSVTQGTGKLSSKIPSNFIKKEIPAMDVSKTLFACNPSPDFGHSIVLNIDQGPPPQSVLDSFDRVPKPEETEFPHISVVRKRSEREKLEGFSCKQCYEYYKNSGLSEEEIQQKKNECSRHRERYRAPDTPEHFWSLGFPDTAEMLERRQKHHSKESPVAANRAPRRRRRLEQKF